MYRRVWRSLNTGGVFYNADLLLASTDHLQTLYLRQWREYMLRNVPQQEVDERWFHVYATEDRPAKLMDHLAWMSETGFSGVDVIWQYYNFAVYGGVKP